ncbi:uncharacterized protein LOC121860321 [Homarus americanus]|uniref:uncharacterized protein LOC121860321 n=1 Tax=Homarus americanus TaxID=6706 RepID=UPI001C443B38|nr:uncharacterized protein LOC121860321 [Homarus americanus]
MDITILPKNYDKGKAYSFTWTSPNYPQSYPDGCTCVLTTTMTMVGFVMFSVKAGSEIADFSNCAEDRLTFVGDTSFKGNKCDVFPSTYTTYLVNMVNPTVPKVSTITFVSSFNDGNTVAKGFSMTILVSTN